MSTDVGARGTTRQVGVSLAGLRFAVFTTRNLVFLIAVLAMNYTLSRPSPVDLLYITSFLITLFYLTLLEKPEVTRRSVMLALLLGAWAVSYFLASMPHFSKDQVGFELLAKTFAISIGFVGAFVSMSWNRRHFETFMMVYIASCVIASLLGTAGFLIQHPLLTWDGRAKGLIDDPNMYGSFLIPAVVFCAYFLSRGQGSKLLLIGSIAVVLLGILLSFSRIAIVAAGFCLFAYIFFHNRRHPRRLVLIVGGLIMTSVALFALASLISAEFTDKLLDRLTFAKAYDLGEQGRYARYMLVLPMILQNPIGVGVLQLEKIFPEPIHNIWLSSFVNYGWGGGISYIILAVGSVVVSLRNYRRTNNEIAIALLISLMGIIFCSSLHEGEHWRHSWLFYGLIWGLNSYNVGLQRPSPARVHVSPVRHSPQPQRRPATAIPSRTGVPAPTRRSVVAQSKEPGAERTRRSVTVQSQREPAR
ncbi:O-antigen ligase family protein [Devosia sp. RR2S18]|uniref:O-antigen ligase family protein n=1 Tax=Devosia rhizosphaerae TaxID=3049774 RepID=UPI0025418858|nr:O-antigen ligase family protein [Devosia sp. RR2S18]WIJ23871.1 O-antigen ligase family protein [Devosia sp. RR2S18]